jgi:hypothetical protein
MEERLLRSEEEAEIPQINRSMAYLWMKRGDIPTETMVFTRAKTSPAGAAGEEGRAQ